MGKFEIRNDEGECLLEVEKDFLVSVQFISERGEIALLGVEDYPYLILRTHSSSVAVPTLSQRDAARKEEMQKILVEQNTAFAEQREKAKSDGNSTPDAHGANSSTHDASGGKSSVSEEDVSGDTDVSNAAEQGAGSNSEATFDLDVKQKDA